MVIFGTLRGPMRVRTALDALESTQGFNVQTDLRISYKGVLSALSLARLLMKMRSLKRLYIVGVKLEGELITLSEALVNLRQLKLLSFSFTFHGDEANSSIDSLANAVSNLELQSFDISPTMLPLLQRIISQPNLQTPAITLLCDGVKEKDISRCFPVIETSIALRELILTGKYELKTKESIENLGSMIKKNTSIVRLRVLVHPTVSLAPVADAIKHNSTIRCLTFWSSNLSVQPSDFDDLSLLLKAIKFSNFSLSQLQLRPIRYVCFMPKPEKEKMLSLLRSIDFYCSLNRHTTKEGHSLRESIQLNRISINVYLEALGNKEMSESMKFYLLRLNPSLWLPLQGRANKLVAVRRMQL